MSRGRRRQGRQLPTSHADSARTSSTGPTASRSMLDTRQEANPSTADNPGGHDSAVAGNVTVSRGERGRRSLSYTPAVVAILLGVSAALGVLGVLLSVAVLYELALLVFAFVSAWGALIPGLSPYFARGQSSAPDQRASRHFWSRLSEAVHHSRRFQIGVAIALIIASVCAALAWRQPWPHYVEVSNTGYRGVVAIENLLAHDGSGRGRCFGDSDASGGKGGACEFVGSQYQVIIPEPGTLICPASRVMVGDFALQVQLTILQHSSTGIYDGGGVVFRSDPSSLSYYRLFISSFGNLQLDVVDEAAHSPPRALIEASLVNGIRDITSLSLDLVVVASGESLAVWVNGHKVGQVSDPAFSQGSIGFFSSNSADKSDGSTIVAFTSATRWRL